ncbi:hypothetical protein [Loktanella sp. M215]|uniref:hypothetical protein n=1 Tax=Loktanella sp. M215 TaxID=2675431 RepID=UPI001F25EC9A|nr:hypothetical protein [Loktanella sp. M215]MCF7699041.1 hypothetical protein [Loktanella sp. M215]
MTFNSNKKYYDVRQRSLQMIGVKFIDKIWCHKKCVEEFVSAAGGCRGNPPETAAERSMVATCNDRHIDSDQY